MNKVLWRELITIPEQVHKSDFVLRLTEGLEKKRQTVDSYVVTAGLAQAFHRALGMIQGALDDNASKASYLHGSFGSGKSHFMAILDLLLDDRDNTSGVRNLKGLAPVLAEHQRWLGSRKLLMVPYHFIGARSMESAILGGYVEFVKGRHPEAGLPGVYLSDSILANAGQLRQSMGDAAFFEMLNKGASAPAASGWGKMAQANGWDAARYERAAAAAPGDAEHARLVGDLVARVLTSVQDTARSQGEGFVSLDEGLSIVSQHAHGLGYDGLILFLDELVLWMASRAADLEFIHREGQKLSKLVEAQNAVRPAPIISFVARQRDLREFVGTAHTGAAIAAFSDSLQWWEGRFDEIKLEDRDLPLIAGERLLKPVSAQAAEVITQGFERSLKYMRDADKDVIRTSEADDKVFRQVYPFSPALVQALIALSTFLQRERTALRLMLMLLVRQRETLAMGDLVPVGDLWDVVAEGEEPFSEEMRRPFQDARTLWDNKLYPMLVREHGIDPALDPEAGTPIKRQTLRNDGRLLKTLLLASLVPNVDALKELTAARLLALNPGTVRGPLPGMEQSLLVGKLRKWASVVGELRVSDEANPRVSIQLASLDPEVLLAQVKHVDNDGNRKRLIKDLLYEWLEIGASDDVIKASDVVWRGAKRPFRVRYQNVRQMTLDALENHGAEWTVVIDYPFDDSEHSPSDDRATVQSFLRERAAGTRTVAWLPSFLSSRGQEQLGRAVKLDYLLNRYDDYAKALPPSERPVMRQLLQNQRSALRAELRRALEVAYGLSNESVDTVDAAMHLDQHLYSLWPPFDPRMPGGQSFAEALRSVVTAGLQARYPKAPALPDERLTGKPLGKLAGVLRDALHSPDRRFEVDDRPLRAQARAYLEPMGLGQMGETHFKASTTWRDKLERALGRRDEVTVGTVRAELEPEGEPTGTPRVFQDMIIMSYAWLEDMAPQLKGVPLEFSWGSLPDDARLVRRALPGKEAWEAAIARSVSLFELRIDRRMRNAGNVESLAQALRKAARARHVKHKAVVQRLGELARALKWREAELASAERLRAARGLDALLTALSQPNAAKLDANASVQAVADIKDEDTVAAYKSQLRMLDANHKLLTRLDLTILEAGQRRASRNDTVAMLLTRIGERIKAHEHILPLAQVNGLDDCYGRLRDLLLSPDPDPNPEERPGGGVSGGGVGVGGGGVAPKAVLATLNVDASSVGSVEAQLRALLKEHGGVLRLEVRKAKDGEQR